MISSSHRNVCHLLAPAQVHRPQVPTLSAEPPEGDGWIHEIKHDGFRTLLRIDGSYLRAFTRGGHDWSDKYGRVIDAGRELKCRSALIDGEIIVQDKHGLSDFAALRAAIEGAPNRLVMFAFDLLWLDGADLRRLPQLSGARGFSHSYHRIRGGPFSSVNTMRAQVQCCSSRRVPWV
jgi:ATP-dependent DNA ligase